jgi:tRNA(Ile2) C34 agmatinyltransferase TiaS
MTILAMVLIALCLAGFVWVWKMDRRTPLCECCDTPTDSLVGERWLCRACCARLAREMDRLIATGATDAEMIAALREVEMYERHAREQEPGN